MLAAGETGSVVTLLCDGGARYAGTYYDDAWVAAQGFDLAPHLERMDAFLASGVWDESLPAGTETSSGDLDPEERRVAPGGADGAGRAGGPGAVPAIRSGDAR